LFPEEWVRQHLIHYLIFVKKYPKGLMKIEHHLKVNQRKKFTDITVFNNLGEPILIAECKSYTLKIKQNNVEQIANYNSALNVSNLVVTNGLTHYVLDVTDSKAPKYLSDIPDYTT